MHQARSMAVLKPCAHAPPLSPKINKVRCQKLQLQPGDQYIITQINKLPADWLRVDIPGSGQRWVRADCGVIHSLNFSDSRCKMNPGLADSHILAYRCDWLANLINPLLGSI